MTRFRGLIVLAALAAGCGEDPAPVSDPAPERGQLVKLRKSQLGPVLFNGTDRAIYTFTLDRGRSRCYGDCAEAWPPFLASDKPSAGAGIDRALLGTVPRRDGGRQVTYAGQPLYFYEHDPKGEVLCNDIAEFGGTWFAVTAEGKKPPA